MYLAPYQYRKSDLMTVSWVLSGEWEPSFIDVPQEGRESMDFITTAQPQWMNLYVSDTGRLDEFFDDTACHAVYSAACIEWV